MNAFLVDLENQPGAFAKVAEAIAKKGVNITNVGGATCGDGGRAILMTADPAATRTALDAIGASFKELEVTETALRHEPGTLATATRRLADAGINVEAILPTGMTGNEVSVGFVTSNPAKAREILSMVGASR
jgi:hypothetical protein